MLSNQFKKFVAVTLLLSGLLGICNLLFAAISANWDFKMLASGPLFIDMPIENLWAFKLAYLCDILGWYVLFIPGLVYLWFYTQKISWGFANYAFVNGVLYIAMGLIGAVILYHVVPSTLIEYHAAQAGSPEQISAKSTFNAFIIAGFHSFFQTIQPVLGGAFLLTTGLLLRQAHQKFATLLIVIGVLRFVQMILVYVGASDGLLHEIAYQGYLFLLPIWCLMVGGYMLSGKDWLENLATTSSR